MNLHSVAEASGYLGSILGVAMVVPQIVRTYSNRALRGVSATSWALTALSCLTWMLYGVRSAELPQIPGNVLLVTGAVIVVLAVPSKASVGARAAVLVLGASALTALAFSLTPAVVGMVGFGIGLVSGVPQLLVSLTRRSRDSAVSLLAWGLRIACQACWLFYAVAIDDVIVMISASFLLTNAALILLSELAARRPTAAREPALAAAG
jgi:uncharacterized protein with PQ loop repeat